MEIRIKLIKIINFLLCFLKFKFKFYFFLWTNMLKMFIILKRNIIYNEKKFIKYNMNESIVLQLF